jgi:hypothetical protein
MATTKPARKRGWHARLLLVVFSIAFTLLLCEVAARVFAWREEVKALEAWQSLDVQKFKPPEGEDASLGHIIRLSKNPRIVYELIPELRFRYVGVSCSTNEHGFRGPPVAVAKPANGYRIVVIGDSVAFGHGVDEQDAFPRQLENLLRSELPNRTVEVINTGVSGYNTAMAVETLADKGLAFAPDLVVYLYIDNDLDLPNFIWKPQDFLTLRRVFLWERMSKAWGARDPWTDQPFGVAPMEDNRFTYVESTVAPQYRDMIGPGMFQRELRRLKSLSDERGFAVIVSAVMPPPKSVIDTCAEIGLMFQGTHDRIAAYTREHGIDDYYRSELVLSPKDAHPRALVHRMIADAILARLLAEKLLPR